MAKQQIAYHIIKALKGLSMEEKRALALDIQGHNQCKEGVGYTTLHSFITSNHFMLTLPHNQAAIRKHLKLADSTPILATFKKGAWVPDSAVENVNQ